MNKQLFSEKYQSLKIPDVKIIKYMSTIIMFEEFIKKEIDSCTTNDIQLYVEYLIGSKQNTYNNLIHIARYFYYIDKKDEYIHMTRYFNTVGVLENIINRVELLESKDLKEELMKSISIPPLGTSTQDLPKYTKDFMDKLVASVPEKTCKKILAGNNHNIHQSTFTVEKEFYKKSKNLETYLKERHNRKVNELQRFYDNNQVWFEQIITKDAIELVKNNQEILSGILKDNKLYVTKIPHDLNGYLHTDDDTLKRYYACHCSFVRESILDKTENIPKEWCYCSGGFAKFPFEVILDQELDVSLLQTPIDGDYVCRFEIDLTNIAYKK